MQTKDYIDTTCMYSTMIGMLLKFCVLAIILNECDGTVLPLPNRKCVYTYNNDDVHDGN